MNPGKRISKMLKLALLFVLIVCSAGAQPQKRETDISSPLSSPVVRIAGVTNRGIVGDDATLVMRVEWTAQTPPGVSLLGFTASVEVEYSDGSKNTGSAQVGASGRQADIRVLNKGPNAPRKFKARVETSFKFFDPNFATRTADFDLTKSNNFDSAGGSAASPNQRPGGDILTIARVRADFNGCGSKDCFTVDWAVGQPRGFTFEQFSVQGEMTYTGDVTVHRSASATTNGGAHSAQLQVDKQKSQFTKIVAKVTINGSATVQKNQTTELQGIF
jgi:hypothetical protein